MIEDKFFAINKTFLIWVLIIFLFLKIKKNGVIVK